VSSLGPSGVPRHSREDSWSTMRFHAASALRDRDETSALKHIRRCSTVASPEVSDHRASA